MTPLPVEVIDDVAALDGIAGAWDQLSVACGRPLSAPGWLLSWWETMAPEGAEPRIFVVRDAGDIVGVAPFYVRRRRGVVEYRPFGSGMANRNEPLATPERASDVAAALAGALRQALPRPGVVHLDQIDVDSPWPGLLTEAWPGRRPARDSERTAPAPVLDLTEDDFDQWLAGKSSNFRQRLGRDRRKLEKRGARTHRVGEIGELERVMEAFADLHGARWGDVSPLATSQGQELMLRAGRRLLASGRFRAYVIETDEQIITVQLFVAAGGEVAYWNGGWDPEWAPMSPAIQGIAAGIADAFELGDRRIDFGEGNHHYKSRLASGDDPVWWPRLYPRGASYPLARGLTVVPLVRARAARIVDRMPPGVRRELDRVRGRAPS